MSILMKHIVRNIFENKVRSITILIIVTLASFVSVITLSLQEVVNKTYESVYSASIGEANITIEGNELFNSDQVNYGTVSIEKKERLLELSGKSILDGRTLKADIRGVDLQEYINMGSVNLIQNIGELIKGECVISLKVSETYHINPGDILTVFIDSNPYEFRVAAVGEINKTFYEEKGNIQLLIDIKDANSILGTDNMISKLRIKTTDPLSNAVASLKADNNQLKVIAGEEYDNLHFQMQSVNGSMAIVLAIILLVGGYIISAIAKIIVVDRIPVIGTFRSIGANQDGIVKVLLLEFISYGFIGTVIGIVLGIIGLPYVADLFNQYKEYGVKTVVSYNPVYLGIAALIGILLPAIVALSTIKKISKRDLKEVILRINVNEELRNTNYTVKALVALQISLVLYFINFKDNFIIGLLGIGALIVGGAFLVQFVLAKIAWLLNKSLLFGGSTELGIKNLKNNRFIKNNSSMIVVISMIFMIIATIIDGISHTAQMDLDSYGFDIITVLNGERDLSSDDIAAYKGVSGAYESYEVMAYGKYANGYCRVYGIDDFSKLNHYMQALSYGGSNLDKKLSQVKNGIVVDQYWARIQNINVGDTITLYYDNAKKDVAADFTVVDTWDCSKGTTDRVFVGISLDNYKKIFGQVPERILAITNSAPEVVAKNIAKDYIDTDISVTTTDEFLSTQVATVNTILKVLVAAVILCSGVIVIGISSNLVVAFMQRKQEYAALYSVGMDIGQLKNMIFWETFTSYVGIAITVALLSVPVVMYIPKLTNGLGLIIDFKVNVIIIVGILLTIGIVSLLTTISPISKVGKMNIVKELKYE